ncbi:hypothetical protein ACFL2Q_13255 [Thermodesulfobacteriota bacterium]
MPLLLILSRVIILSQKNVQEIERELNYIGNDTDTAITDALQRRFASPSGGTAQQNTHKRDKHASLHDIPSIPILGE